VSEMTQLMALGAVAGRRTPRGKTSDTEVAGQAGLTKVVLGRNASAEPIPLELRVRLEAQWRGAAALIRHVLGRSRA
jgi:hypothetical protein